MPAFDLIVVTGPTATGKTRLAALLADKIGAEIISADSRQVYRHMNLGTGKDYNDYIVNGSRIPFHLVDICEPGEEYNLYRFYEDFSKAKADIVSRGKEVILCGGTGMYLEAALGEYNLVFVPQSELLRSLLKPLSQDDLARILEQLKPLHNITDTTNRERTLRAIEIAISQKQSAANPKQVRALIIGLKMERSQLRKRITERLHKRLGEGMVQEVATLIEKGVSQEKLEYYGLEYRFIGRYLRGEIDYNNMVSLLNTAIHQFAKRQMTWFRRMERKGFFFNWIDANLPDEEKLVQCMRIIASQT